ncbi:MAG: hypothetical protein NC187_08490 [Candidatus Amulumruptor caecigallinarius]|nr:hypothetical protein [Candidatus Amulumruptor caecigallinarius]MCM1397506.1 hypothetical protein [Candidatus Amulumruptor caecigallinarius]MCM1454408.1 hypothetical protein [bacterium]
MSVISTFLHSIGLGHTDTDPDDDDAPEFRPVTTPRADEAAGSADSAAPSAVESAEAAGQPEVADLFDPSLPGCIFDSVIRLFNRTMPEFVTRCLDTDSQRQYLYHAIESDVRRQIELVARRARVYGAAMATPLPVNPDAAADDARRRDRQLLADSERRRKACEHRIADLEAMLAKAGAREAALAEENARLQSRLRRSRLKPDEADGQLSLFS